MIKLKTIILVFLLIFSASSMAEIDPIEQLKNFLKTTKSLTTTFQQTAFDEYGNPGMTSEGKFYLQRPRQFRWNYEKPFVQQIVASADKVWFYDADLEQVTIKKMDPSLENTPALLLSGDIPLEDNFIVEKQGEDGALTWIKLLPKDENNNYKYILISIEKGQLSGMELNDNFGQLTRIYFNALKINVAIAASVFEFVAPEGVDVFSE